MLRASIGDADANGKPVSRTPPLWKALLVFLAPMMPSNILQSLFGAINNIYLGG